MVPLTPTSPESWIPLALASSQTKSPIEAESGFTAAVSVAVRSTKVGIAAPVGPVGVAVTEAVFTRAEVKVASRL